MQKKSEGGAGIYLLGIYIMIFLLTGGFLLYRKQLLSATYILINDSIMTALFSGAVVNLEEYGSSHQLVIHENLGNSFNLQWDKGMLNANDKYLWNSYNKFLEVLRTNCDLDKDLKTKNKVIDGQIRIKSYQVYNVYYQFDEWGNKSAYRIVAYLYENGNWICIPYEVNTPVHIYDSLTREQKEITTVTVAVSLCFDLSFLPQAQTLLSEENVRGMLLKTVEYQRLVDIQVNEQKGM